MVPLLVLGLGGVIKWALHGGKYPRRDFFLVGIELALTAITLSFTNIFDWFRKDMALAANLPSNYFEVLLYVSQLLVALTALLVVLGAMRHYIDNIDREPRVGWGRWFFINGIGGMPRGFTVYLLA